MKELKTIIEATEVPSEALDFIDGVERAFKLSFPKGHFSGHARDSIGEPTISFIMTTLPRSEWNNGIMHNDPSFNQFMIHNPYGPDGMNDKIKVSMLVGNRFGPAQSSVKVGWRDGTTRPSLLIKKFEKYFKKLRSLVDAAG